MVRADRGLSAFHEDGSRRRRNQFGAALLLRVGGQSKRKPRSGGRCGDKPEAVDVARTPVGLGPRSLVAGCDPDASSWTNPMVRGVPIVAIPLVAEAIVRRRPISDAKAIASLMLPRVAVRNPSDVKSRDTSTGGPRSPSQSQERSLVSAEAVETVVGRRLSVAPLDCEVSAARRIANCGPSYRNSSFSVTHPSGVAAARSDASRSRTRAASGMICLRS